MLITFCQARENLKISEKDAAAYIGVTVRTLRRWEKNSSRVSQKYGSKIMRLYSIGLNHLFFGSKEEWEKYAIKKVDSKPCTESSHSFQDLKEENRQDLLRILELFELYRDTQNTSLQQKYIEEMRLIEHKYGVNTTPNSEDANYL